MKLLKFFTAVVVFMAKLTLVSGANRLTDHQAHLNFQLLVPSAHLDKIQQDVYWVEMVLNEKEDGFFYRLNLRLPLNTDKTYTMDGLLAWLSKNVEVPKRNIAFVKLIRSPELLTEVFNFSDLSGNSLVAMYQEHRRRFKYRR